MMMSHEEHHRQPAGEEEEGEDDQRDIEARTAVEALLALTSPTDYTHHSGYEEDYMMESVGEGYLKTASVDKDRMEEAYNSTQEEEEEEEEMDVEEKLHEGQKEVDSGGYVRTLEQPLRTSLGLALETHDRREALRQATVTNVAAVKVNNEIAHGELSGEEKMEASEGDAKDTSQSDDGLKQLQAFIQATEGRQESVVVVRQAIGDRAKGDSGSGGGGYSLGGHGSVLTETPTAAGNNIQSVGQHRSPNSKTHTKDSGENKKAKESVVPNKSLQDMVTGAGTGGGGKGGEINGRVGVAADIITNTNAVKAYSAVVEKLSSSSSSLSPHSTTKDNQGMDREVMRTFGQGNSAFSSTSDMTRYGELEKVSRRELCAGESLEEERWKHADGNGGGDFKEEELSEESESDVSEQRQVGKEEGEKQRAMKDGKLAGNGDSSDSEDEEEEDGDSDSSSSSSGSSSSSSSSSNDSDTEGSESESESENESKSAGSKTKETTASAASLENIGTKRSVASVLGGELSERKDSEVKVKQENKEDSRPIDKRSSDPARGVASKPRLIEPLKIPGTLLSHSDAQKPGDKTNVNEQPKNSKTTSLNNSEESIIYTKPLLPHSMPDTTAKPLTQNARDVKLVVTQNAQNTKPPTDISTKETKILTPQTEEVEKKVEKVELKVKEKRRSSLVAEEGPAYLSLSCNNDVNSTDPQTKSLSSDLEKNSGADKDSKKNSTDVESKLSVDSKNSLTVKVVDPIVSRTEKTVSSMSSSNGGSGGMKLLSDKEKLFNNNSISITKSSLNTNNRNNTNKNKDNNIINGNKGSEVTISITKQAAKPSGGSSPRGSSSQHTQMNLVQEVTAAFVQHLSSIQTNQTLNNTKVQHETSSGATKSGSTLTHRPQTPTREMQEVAEEDGEKGDSEIEDMYPIQAEVVMSEGSESDLEYDSFGKQQHQQEHLGPQGDLSWCRKGKEMLDPSEKESMELMAYLKTYVNGISEGELVEYPPPNNELPPGGRDLTQWQLEGVRLPPFIPTVAPPPWLRLTIPAEGYRCQSCDDTFFIESSLVQHQERRSVWISLECGPCDAKLTFYNRCALKDHLRNHMLQGEEVDEETVEVRSLPLQLTRLLQPVLVPVPDSLRMPGKVPRMSKSRGSVNKLPVLKPIGRLPTNYLKEGAGDGAAMEEDQEDTGDQEEGFMSPSDSAKIPPGMKRLSPRKRTVRCYLCERMFHSVRELMAHMRTDQPYSDQRVECKKCQLVLPSVCAAKAHILTHPPANTTNISVCPECGSSCDGPREFVHHLNTCGHQFRRSGVVCTECQVCFFRSQDDFLTHWISEHCAKSYECVICQSTFESLVFHKCSSPGQQVLATFRCLLTCPLCAMAVQLHAQEDEDTNSKIRAHLAEAHPTIITRVHYVYKSKFCTNAFRSKDELRAHHDREHRRDNHYRTKTCTLHHEVLGYQHQYFSGQEPRNAFVTLPVALSAEELHEARIRDVPTVSSVIDKTLFPDMVFLEGSRGAKGDKTSRNKSANKSLYKEGENKEAAIVKEMPVKKDMDQLDKLRPKVCYRCGFHYADNKDFRRHKRTCEGEAAERHCLMCGLTAVGEDFARHCLGHVQEGALICIYCNATQFSNVADLEQHFELHVHEQFSYPASCAFCCTSLPDVLSALTHINEEHDPLHVPFDTSEFECDKCGRRFHGERGLSVHVGRCTLGASTPTPASAGCRQCQVCTKALTPEIFGRHMVCHLEEGLLVCSLCDGRTLPSSMALLHHLEEHAASLTYPYSCPMCSFSMVDASSSLTHLKEEHGFGNLHCAECDMHFNFTYQLQRHTDIVHKICQYAKRRYICWICRAYDHVKKETLMNHFRTVHGLDRQQVDEKVMIRTRGQGTMPTSQFIPTKPLGSKENQTNAAATKDSESSPSKAQKDKAKTSLSKSSSANKDSPVKQSNSIKSPTVHQTKEPPLKTVVPAETPTKEDMSSKINPSHTLPREDGPPRLIKEENLAGETSNSFPLGRDSLSVTVTKCLKSKDKMKVLVKRLPNSILDEASRSKRRKTEIEDQKTEADQEKKEDLSKEERLMIKKKKKKKKKKAYKCPICLFGTNFKDKMDAHILKHKEKGEDVVGEADGFVCRECGASFVVEPSLARHMFFAHKVKLQVPGGGEVKCETDMRVKEEPDSDVNIPVKEEFCIKEEKEIKVEKGKTITKKKVKRETGKKKMLKARSELRSRIGETPTLRRKPPKSKPKRRLLERATSSALTITLTTKRRDDKGKRRVAKEGGRKNSERQCVGIKRELEEEEEEEEEENKDAKLDNQCVVCKEEFTNPVELYSHLRTHGMAFLKLGHKARTLGLGKPQAPDR